MNPTSSDLGEEATAQNPFSRFAFKPGQIQVFNFQIEGK